MPRDEAIPIRLRITGVEDWATIRSQIDGIVARSWGQAIDRQMEETIALGGTEIIRKLKEEQDHFTCTATAEGLAALGTPPPGAQVIWTATGQPATAEELAGPPSEPANAPMEQIVRDMLAARRRSESIAEQIEYMQERYWIVKKPK